MMVTPVFVLSCAHGYLHSQHVPRLDVLPNTRREGAGHLDKPNEILSKVLGLFFCSIFGSLVTVIITGETTLEFSLGGLNMQITPSRLFTDGLHILATLTTALSCVLLAHPHHDHKQHCPGMLRFAEDATAGV